MKLSPPLAALEGAAKEPPKEVALLMDEDAFFLGTATLPVEVRMMRLAPRVAFSV